MSQPFQFDAFQLSSVPDVHFAAGATEQLGQLAAKLGIRRAFIVTDPGIVQHGLLDTALNSLAASNIHVDIYTDVVADPPESIVNDAVHRAKKTGCDGVIGFGGGSSMDVAKLLAVLIKDQQPLSDIYGVDQITSGRIPLIQVPTTAGTGSEATMVSIVTTGETTKAGVVSRVLLADQIILDPLLTLGLPAHVTAATGIDAMVHAIEAYTSIRLKNPLSDMLARQALQLMCANISIAVHQGDNLPARSAMLLGAMLAGQAFANAPVAAVHALAYPLGGNYHIPHGLSNSLVLPHVLQFNSADDQAAQWYSELAPLILQDVDLPADNQQVCQQLADHFLNLANQLGLPTQLRDMDIKESALVELAEQAMLQQRLLINNPREVSYDDALHIYQNAY